MTKKEMQLKKGVEIVTRPLSEHLKNVYITKDYIYKFKRGYSLSEEKQVQVEKFLTKIYNELGKCLGKK